MERLKKVWGVLTNPNLIVVRVLVMVFLIVFFVSFMIFINLFLSTTREHDRMIGKLSNTENPVPNADKKDLFAFSVNESKKIENIIIADVTIHNPSDQKVYFPVTDFKLKDERLMLCEMISDAHLLEKEKKSALPTCYLLPKEGLRGAVLFRCPDSSVKEYILRMGGVEQKFTPEEYK